MNADYEDRILEAGLDEVLGGQYPPDLSAKILQAIENRQAAATRTMVSPVSLMLAPALVEPPPVVVADVTLPPVGRPASPLASPRPLRRRQNQTTWLSVVVAASLLIAMVSIGVYVGQTSSHRWGGLLVQSDPPVEIDSGSPESGGPRIPDLPDRQFPLARGPEPETAGSRDGASLPDTSAQPVLQPGESTTVASRAATAVRRGTPSSDADMIAFVNEMLGQQWRQRGVTPAPPPDDPQWCQRVYQRLVGRGPTDDELRQFLDGPRNGRRAELVDRLLASEDYVRHWSAFWADVLLGTSARDPNPAGIDRGGLEQFLADSLRDNKPYDRLAADLISATGSCDPQSPDFNGAANFLAAFGGDGFAAATDRVSRVFLGQQLVCARCHNDPASGREQDDFWALNAFFRQMQVRRSAADRFASLADADFHGETGIPKDAEIFYRGEDGRLRVAYPEFGPDPVPKSGLLADVNRRQELARLLVEAPDFRTAAVNRVWAGLLRYGFVEPVDDVGPHNRPSHPELLKGLSDQLEAHDFNLASLMRWIVLSKAFDVSDQPTAESWMDTPETGGPPLFARFYADPAKPVDVYKDLMLAVRTRPSGSGLQARTLARHSWTPVSATIPQIIDTQGAEVMVGPSWLDRLASSGMSRESKVEHLFRAVLDRPPTARELTAAKLVLADRMNDQLAIRELWQTLLAGRNGA
jgi:hypothetical protein